MSRFNVNINPQMLKWAREEAGFDVSEIAGKINVSVENYKIWEKEGENIPFGKLKTLSRQYKRQIAVFFLPQVPEKLSKPIDFRNLKPSQSKLSRDVLMVMRDVTYFRQTAVELQGENYWKIQYEWLKEIENFKQDNENLAIWLREKLNISVEDQFSWKYDSQAYKTWRQSVEDNLGILVFQFPMPLDEIQGFCYTDNLPFAIVVNSRHSYRSRLFTIFHELGHIVRHHSGMCIIDEVNENQREEFSCNSLAGNFLVPENYLVATVNLAEIETYANQFRVSREVYLRQLKEQNKIHPTKFFSLLNEIKSTYKPSKKSSGFALPEVKSRATRGETFFNLILDSLNQNRISYTQASSLLDLRITKVLNEA